MQENEGKICVYYATQTGNAHQLSIQTSIILKNKLSSVEQLDENSIFVPGNLYILFISTTGQGDPPYSMRLFWKKMMNKNYPSMIGVKFCIYGLGDRSYGDNFNIMARKMRQRMLMLKAEQVINIGLGDQQDSNGCFQQYFKTFIPALSQYLQNNDGKYSYPMKLEGMNERLLSKGSRKTQKWEILQQKLLTCTQDRQVYWISLRLAPQQQKIQRILLGDILQIYPYNSQQSVQQMVKYFQSNNLNDIGLEQERLRVYLKQSANLQNLVNFTFFAANEQWGYLHNMIDSQIDSNIRQLLKQKIKQLANDYDEYFNYIKKYRRNVRQVITDFSLRIPLSVFINRLGKIISRKYSIAQIYEDSYKLSLLVKLQKVKITNNRQVKGLCSYDLCLSSLLSEKNTRPGRILRNGQFSINSGLSANLKILMVSLGTGIAPFLSILGEALRNENNWQLVLFHSSRYRKEIPQQKQLIQPLIKSKKLKTFITCTRDKDWIQNRRIQEIIRQNKQMVSNFSEGKIFICGTKQLCDIICRIFEQQIGLDIKSLKKKRVICIQNW